MNIEALISKAAGEAVKALYGMDATEKMLQLQKTRSEFEGNLTLVVFPFVKAAKKSPEQTAQEIGEYLVANCAAVEKFNVVKGFLNLSVGDGAWLQLLDAIDKDEHFGMKQATDESPLVMIEYSSPNTNKPLHLGHVRNNLLGWSLAQIMEANGNKVVKTNIVNDRGIHICKSMLAWLKYGNGETPETSGKKGDHLIGDYYVAFDKHYREEVKELVAQGMDEEKAKQEAPLIKEAHEMLVKWEQNDPEVRALWEKMNNWVYAGFDETYKKMGVSFDKIYYESQTYLKGKAKVEEGLAKGLFERHEDNSVWADLTNEGLDQKLLLRSDGTSVYMTQDIGTAEMRFKDYPIDKMIYVVGNEQNYHFQGLSVGEGLERTVELGGEFASDTAVAESVRAVRGHVQFKANVVEAEAHKRGACGDRIVENHDAGVVIGKADFVFGANHAETFDAADLGLLHLEGAAIGEREFCTNRSEHNGLAGSHVRGAANDLDGLLAVVHRRDVQVVAVRVGFAGKNLCHNQLFINLARFFHAFDFQADGGEGLCNFFRRFRKINMTSEPIQRNFHLFPL